MNVSLPLSQELSKQPGQIDDSTARLSSVAVDQESVSSILPYGSTTQASHEIIGVIKAGIEVASVRPTSGIKQRVYYQVLSWCKTVLHRATTRYVYARIGGTFDGTTMSACYDPGTLLGDGYS